MSDEKLGVHSETGRLRQVILCKPGRAHRRLTPANKDELLFDDVFWVKQARKDHDAFSDLMRAEGVEVLDTGELLAEVLALDEARAWVLDHQITTQDVGVGMLDDLRAWLNEMASTDLADILIGGLTVSDLPFEPAGMFGAYLGGLGFVLAPLPNMLFTRDNSAWIYGGVTLNPMYWQARQPETLLSAAIYRWHPKFAGKAESIWGDPTRNFGRATLEGGDIMPAGDGLVLIGMGERTSPQAVGLLAESLFDTGRASRVLACQLPKSRAAMHLDTVFTFCGEDIVTSFTDVAEEMRVFDLRPGEGHAPLKIRRSDAPMFEVLAEAMGYARLRIIPTGGNDAFEESREQWNDGNNVLALRPGVVVGYDRNDDTNAALRAGPVAVRCRSFDGIMCSKGDELWAQEERMNFAGIAVRIALTSGLTRRQVADDLGVGLSTLNKWVTAHRDTDVVSPEDRELARENERLRRENRILREERDILTIDWLIIGESGHPWRGLWP